jgi:nucleoside triphosphate diphosphatase
MLALVGESLAKLIELVAHLRGPDGCAWDQAQNYDSMKGLLLEEAYEVIDAVNKRDLGGLQDELGDLLFQVVFYAQLAEEERHFTLDDVIKRLHAKLIRRHPHVFGETRARTPEEALASWLTVKEQEREASRESALTQQPESLLDGLPEALPATLEAYELGVRAAEVGFDWASADDLLNKVIEEVSELRHELAERIPKLSPSLGRQPLAGPEATVGKMPADQGGTGPPPVGRLRSRASATERSGPHGGRLEEEIGDLLFTACNLARYLGSDPESCLRRANLKFKIRFRALEQKVAGVGNRIRDCTPEELDRSWNAVKEEVRSKEEEQEGQK